MNIEEQERVEAVDRYIMGDKPADICRDTDRSKKWLFKWVNRFKTGDEGWYKSQSRAPKSQGKETCKEIETAVINIRKSLMGGSKHKSKYLGVDADAVRYKMHELGFIEKEIPSVSTIKRIVKKHNLKVNKRERYKRVKSKKRYTILNPTKIDEMHQMDWVGPRFIKGYGAISSLNLIDVASNQVHIEQYTAKSMDNVIAFLTRYWSDNVIPKYLQVDNGMCFIGDFKYPRKFSRFIRLCLHVGIEIVFIAPKSPWMNGSIENFNKWFGTKFWEKETFVSLGDIRIKSKHFVSQHNDLSAWKKRDMGLTQIEPVRMLKDVPETNFAKLPLTEGKIHFIIKVNSEGAIGVLNEDVDVGKEFIGEYILATVCLKKQTIEVYYQGKEHDTAMLIKEFNYTVNEAINSRRQEIWKT